MLARARTSANTHSLNNSTCRPAGVMWLAMRKARGTLKELDAYQWKPNTTLNVTLFCAPMHVAVACRVFGLLRCGASVVAVHCSHASPSCLCFHPFPSFPFPSSPHLRSSCYLFSLSCLVVSFVHFLLFLLCLILLFLLLISVSDALIWGRQRRQQPLLRWARRSGDFAVSNCD